MAEGQLNVSQGIKGIKRPSESMDNDEESNLSANKAQKSNSNDSANVNVTTTSQQHIEQPVAQFDDNTSVSQLKVKDLQAILAMNFQIMHVETLASMSTLLKSEIGQLEQKVNTMKDELVSKTDFEEKMKACDIKHLEFDIEMASLKCSIAKAAESSEVNNLKERVQAVDTTNKQLSESLEKQQSFLETLDADKRASNLIITGVGESSENEEEGAMQHEDRIARSDEEKIQLIIDIIGAGHVGIASVLRLGERHDGPGQKPRPIKVVLKERSDRRDILTKAKELKNAGPNLSSVYINKDMHPAVRKERGRIRQVLKSERQKPENQGRNVVFDQKSQCIMVDDVVIDKYQPSFLSKTG